MEAQVEQELTQFVADAKPVLTKLAADEQELANLAPVVADALIAAGHLDANQRDTAIQNIRTEPVKVAQCLKSLAENTIKTNQGSAPAAMGSGEEGSKKASVGTGKQVAMRESDYAYLHRLNLA
jgi:hypothetical protein